MYIAIDPFLSISLVWCYRTLCNHSEVTEHYAMFSGKNVTDELAIYAEESGRMFKRS